MEETQLILLHLADKISYLESLEELQVYCTFSILVVFFVVILVLVVYQHINETPGG